MALPADRRGVNPDSVDRFGNVRRALLYQHVITATATYDTDKTITAVLSIITTSSTALTASTLAAQLVAGEYVSANALYPCTGSTSDTDALYAVYYDSTNSKYVLYDSNDATIDITEFTTFSDKIRTI